MLKLFRVGRILKLVKNFQKLQRLVQTIIFSFPSLLNATSLLFLAYFLFSILASNIFGKINFLIYTNNNNKYLFLFKILFHDLS